MKKIVTILLAAVMMLSALSAPAFAAGSTTVSSDRTATISATVTTYVNSSNTEVSGDSSAAVMSVTIEWDDVDFVYDETTKWDANKLDYVVIKGAWESDASANVTITNRSNCKVEAEVYFTKTNTDEIYANVGASFDRRSAIIASAVGAATAPSENFVLTLTGKPDTTVSSSKKELGIITVIISAVNNGSVTGGSQDGNDNDT